MTVVRPTPTADEQNRHARGERLDEHEPDGSPEQVIHPELKAAADELKKKKLAEDEAKKPKVEVEAHPPPLEAPPIVEHARATEADHKRSTYKTRTTRREDD